MADEVEPIVEDTRTGEQKKQHQELGNLTAESEKESVDSEKAMKAMTALTVKNQLVDEAKEARRKALMAVKVVPADVDFIVHELEVSREIAELAIREKNGDVASAIQSLIHA